MTTKSPAARERARLWRVAYDARRRQERERLAALMAAKGWKYSKLDGFWIPKQEN